MRRVMLDSNALDPLLYASGAFEALDEAVKSGGLEVLFTHVTVDELAAISDLEKRQWLLNLLIALGRIVDTSGAVAEFSRANFCRVMSDDDQSFEPLRSHSIRHSRDALIAHTALNEDCVLITNEKKRLPARARECGVEVLTTGQLLSEFGFTLPPAGQAVDEISTEVLAAVAPVIEDFAAKDQDLVRSAAHELAIVHRVAVYLERRLWLSLAQHGLAIDLDYDRHEGAFKFLPPRRDREGHDRFRPDLIVHARGHDKCNILVMEFKKEAGPTILRDLWTRIQLLLAPGPSPGHYAYKLGVIVDVRAQSVRWRTVTADAAGGNWMDDDEWTVVPIPDPTSATAGLAS